jgi:hypothetical protein
MTSPALSALREPSSSDGGPSNGRIDPDHPFSQSPSSVAAPLLSAPSVHDSEAQSTLDSEQDDEEDSDTVSIVEQPTQPASASAGQQEARAQQLVSALREEHEAHSDAPGVHEEESEEEDDEDEDDEDDEEDEDEEPTLKYEKFGSDVMNALKRDTASAIAVANKRVVSRLVFFPASSPECTSGSGNTYGYRPCHGSHREHCQDVSASRRIRP